MCACASSIDGSSKSSARSSSPVPKLPEIRMHTSRGQQPGVADALAVWKTLHNSTHSELTMKPLRLSAKLMHPAVTTIQHFH